MHNIMFDTIICDEATRIANHASKQSKLIKTIFAKHKYCLTGTPLSNNIQNIWSILDFCQPGLLGSFWNFSEKYCVKDHFGGIVGYKNLNELKETIKNHMIRRLKSEVLTELPDKMYETIYIEFSPTERKLYNAIKKEILTELKKDNVSAKHLNIVLVKMTKLRQAANSLELISDVQTSSKTFALKELLNDIMQNDSKAIIFTEFKEMANILHRELSEYHPLLYTGDTGNEERNETVKKFNENEENLLLIMTSAGSFGLNLQRAKYVIHYDCPWSIAKIEQREGRVHRINQTNKVTIFNLIMSKSIDEYILKVLHKKQKMSRDLLGDSEEIKKVKITKYDIKKMLDS